MRTLRSRSSGSLAGARSILPIVALLAAPIAAGAGAGGDDAEIEGFFGDVVLSNGDPSLVHGLRIRRGPDQPWTAFAVMSRPDRLRFAIDFAPGVLPSRVDQLVRFTSDVPTTLTVFDPRDLMFEPTTDPVTSELNALLAGGDLTHFPSVPVPGCMGDPFVPLPPPGSAAGSEGGERCPNNNCTDWLREWLEDAREIARASKNYSAARYISKVLESDGAILDRDHDHTPPGQCAVYATYVPGALGPPTVYISPECVRQGAKFSIAAIVLEAGLKYSDPALFHGDEAETVVAAVLAAYAFQWYIGEEMLDAFKLFKKMAAATGARQAMLGFCMIIEAYNYRGEGTPEVRKKLRRLGRELDELKKEREGWTEEQKQAHEAWVNGRYQRLRSLILAGDWTQIAAEFGIPQDCIDPALVQCIEDTPTLCGSVDAGPCDEPHDTAGCEDRGCCESVCAEDPFCCDSSWDDLCVQQAAACQAPPACFGSVADCCTAHETPGCNDPACCGAVCELDPFCCDAIWDPLCALNATAACAATCGHLAPCGDPVAGDCCGANGNASCNDAACCQTVCKSDPYCCDTEWDALCGDRAGLLCADACAPPLSCADAPPGASPCAVHEGPLADAPGCCESVCAVDPFCCQQQWDQICVLGALELCGDLCPPPAPCPAAGSCFEAHDLPGCDDPELCAEVCAADPFCCDVEWDQVCVFLAQDAEANECPYFCTPCPGDLDGDGFVGVTDFLGLLASWGPCPECPADLDGDGLVGVVDFLDLLANWGRCPE